MLYMECTLPVIMHSTTSRMAGFLTILLCALFLGASCEADGSKYRCEKNEIPLCKGHDIPYYPHVMMPNFLGHNTQEEVNLELLQYFNLLLSGCSPDLRVFLCTFYAPPCMGLGDGYKACRSLCETVREECEPTMKKLGLHWPEFLACEQLQTHHICFGEQCGTSIISDHMGTDIYWDIQVDDVEEREEVKRTTKVYRYDPDEFDPDDYDLEESAPETTEPTCKLFELLHEDETTSETTEPTCKPHESMYEATPEETESSETTEPSRKLTESIEDTHIATASRISEPPSKLRDTQDEATSET